MRTLMCESGSCVLVFYDGVEEPEEMELSEFIAAYGVDALPDESSLVGEIICPEYMPEEPDLFDVVHYYAAFRKLLEDCGEYSHKDKLLKNSKNGVPIAKKIVKEYYDGSNRKLEESVKAWNHEKDISVLNLDYWSRRVGFKKMSTPQDVEDYNLRSEADTEILLRFLEDKDRKKRMYNRIDKYAERNELKSVLEIMIEVQRSYEKRPRKSP